MPLAEEDDGLAAAADAAHVVGDVLQRVEYVVRAL